MNAGVRNEPYIHVQLLIIILIINFVKHFRLKFTTINHKPHNDHNYVVKRVTDEVLGIMKKKTGTC